MYGRICNVVCNILLCEHYTIILDNRSKSDKRLSASLNVTKLIDHVEIGVSYHYHLCLIGLDVRDRRSIDHFNWSLIQCVSQCLIIITIIRDGRLVPLCKRHIKLRGSLLFSLRGESLNSQLGDTVFRSNFIA